MFFLIFLPFLGVLIYLIAHGQDMGKRDIEQAQARRGADGRLHQIGAGRAEAPTDQRSRRRSSCSTAARSRKPEFDALKAKALA